jgi:broad specificity phosphatase PhoE
MISRREFLSTSFALLAPACLPAAPRPRQILIIRHGEKTGAKSDPHLNPRGAERAVALVRLFPAHFDTPQVLFATRRSAHSNREVETIEPLSHALHLGIDSRFADDDYAALAKELLAKPAYSRKNVLVCWHHGRIPELAAALGVAHPPKPWPDSQFDRVWKIEYSGAAVQFTDLPQHLLEGDS